MIPLTTRGMAYSIDRPIVGRVSRDPEVGYEIVTDDGNLDVESVSWMRQAGLITTRRADQVSLPPGIPAVCSVESVRHLEPGDAVALLPSGHVNTLFRVSSRHNALFATNRCNSNCLMCSQPPRDIDDLDSQLDINSQLIPLIPRSTEVIGITGGEPTLLGHRLVEMMRLIGDHLPDTEVHLLTNGRAFAWLRYVQQLVPTTDRVVFGIPLYSDYPAKHDFVVQSRGAFAQTVLGMHNLARYSQRMEIRVVLQRQTSDRLVALARYIHKNLPFVEHVAFMGLEHVGFARHNWHLLWTEPREYVAELAESVQYLTDFGFSVSLYNLQLCLLPPGLWPYCRSSISDWKREYLGECQRCGMKESCGGVFGTSKAHSNHIRAIEADS